MVTSLRTIFVAALAVFGMQSSSAIAQAASNPPPAKPSQASSEEVKHAPEYRLASMTGKTIDSAKSKDKVVVMVYVVPRQRGSERAIFDASQIVKDLQGQPIELLFITAKPEQQAYFEQFWKEKKIKAPLAFDADRKLYAQLKLIAFPTTLVIDREGIIIHKIPTHSVSYSTNLGGYARYALGLIDDSGLEEHLKAQHLPLDSSKSLASRHRTVSRLMKQKGYLDAAEKELHRALELDPESIDARLDMADLLMQVDRLDEAETYLDEVLQTELGHRRVLLLKGILQFRNSNFVQAEETLTQVLVLNPDPARAHFYLGRVFEARGKKDNALEHYRQALSRLLDEPID